MRHSNQAEEEANEMYKQHFEKHIILQAKYGTTHYFNRDKISSALEEIDGSTKSDLYLQLRLKF